jgi:hypothetical protein
MTHHRGASYLLLIIFVIATSSCTVPSPSASPAPTHTSTTLPLSTVTSIPSSEPTLAPSSMPTETPPSTPMVNNLYLPIGLATAPISGGQVAYYDLQGQLLGEFQSPNLGTGLFQQVHIAGPLTYSPGPVLPPLVFYASNNGGELWLNNNNNLSIIVASPNLVSLVGVPGKPTVAYSLSEYVDVGVRSQLFIGDSQTLPNSSAVLDNINSASYAIKPLAISMENQQPSGVWFTMIPYGIGGDIVFEPRQTLNYLSLADYNITTNLDITKGPAGLSDDQTWTAYTPSGGDGPMRIAHDFDYSSSITFPLREDSDRGAGNAVFSPDDQYLAWREAGGSLMDQSTTFHETIRIGSVDGNILADIPDTALLSISGFSDIGRVIPVGWLDSQTLALEVKDINTNSASILTVHLDGLGITLLASGSFVGFLYPTPD